MKEAKILIAGDYCPVGRVTKYIDNGDFGALFNGFEKFTEKVDFSIVNLECPITNYDRPILKSGPNIRAINSIGVLESIKFAGFDLLTLANNHILDYGEQGIVDTLSAINRINLKHVGVGPNTETAGEGVKIKFGGKILAVLNIAENEFCAATDKSYGAYTVNLIHNFNRIQKLRSECDFLLLIYHGGREHVQLPTPLQRERLKFYLDSGADAVVAHHTHCYSGYEFYKGKPIFYSLGNFIFDYKEKYRSGKWTEGYFVNLVINFDQRMISNFELVPYFQGRKRDCTLKIIEDEIELTAFNKKIQELNTILSDDLLYQLEWDRYLKTQKRGYLSMLYHKNKYIRAAASLGYWPIFRNRKFELTALNLNRCESHNEILKEILK